MSVTIVVTSHTPRVRNGLLTRALDSVWNQSHLPDAVVIALDHYHQGAARTRNRALFMANTEWIVFLDSDDILYPTYLKRVFEHQEETKADVVIPWYDVKGAADPLLCNKEIEWDHNSPHSFTITCLVRRELAVNVGGFPVEDPVSKWCLGEDFPFWVKLSSMGAKFSKLPENLWEWNHNPQGGNTSGIGSRWV